MRLNEIAVKPKTPEQLRIDSLKAAKDRAADALAKERQNQQVIKAQKNLSALQTAKIKTSNVQ